MEIGSTGLWAEGAWKTDMNSDAFKTLVRSKLRFIIVMSVVFVTFYIGLSILSGFARPLLATKVVGSLNLGFVLIAANYVMSWIIAIIYARVSGRDHDPLVDQVIAHAVGRNGAKGNGKTTGGRISA